MALTSDMGVTGLWRDPSPHSEAPDGGLDRAEEVVFRRKGTAEPRPGFKADDTFASLENTLGILPYDGTYLAVGTAPAETATTYWASGTGVDEPGGGALEWHRDAIRAQESRKNLYLTTSDAMRKVTGNGDTEATPVGLPVPVLEPQASSSGTSLEAGKRVAYRAVFKRVDANNVTVVSTPSGRLIYDNTDATDPRDPIVRVIWSDATGVVEGDIIELYRTRSTAVASPSDELLLAAEVIIATADITNGYVEITDAVDDDDLGAALYTNSSREGFERANTAPPLATDVALFAGSLFASRITWPQRLLIKWTDVNASVGDADGIGIRLISGCTLTNGSDEITTISDTAGIEVGTIVAELSNNDWSGTGPIVVTAVAANSVTVSETWEGSTMATTANMGFSDSIAIKVNATTTYYPAFSANALMISIAHDEPTLASFEFRTQAHTSVVGYAIGDAQLGLDVGGFPDGGVRRVVIEGLLPSSDAFEVFATHGDEYYPPLPLPTEANGEPSVQDDFPNGIVWSKQDEPEHFTRSPASRRLVGKENVPVLRILRAGERLWVLKGKGDGIYKLSGFGERSGFRVDQVDADTYLLHPNLACVLGESVYAWTNKGAVKIDDGGIVSLSEPAIGVDFEALEIHLDHDVNDVGTFCAANEKDGEIVWGLPAESIADGTTEEYAERTYVLNTENRAWSQWFVGTELYASAAYDPELRLLRLGAYDAGAVYVERGPDEATVTHADLEHSCTISTISGDTITIAGGSGWTPAVGDLIHRSGGFGVVVDVTSATVFDVHDAAALTTGAATGYVHYDAALAWLTKTGKAPAALKRYTEVVTHWEDTFGIYAWGMVYAPSIYGATTVVAHTRDYSRTADSEDDRRTFVPRVAALGSRLGITLAISQADARWRLSGLSVQMESAGRRLNR